MITGVSGKDYKPSGLTSAPDTGNKQQRPAKIKP